MCSLVKCVIFFERRAHVCVYFAALRVCVLLSVCFVNVLFERFLHLYAFVFCGVKLECIPSNSRN